MEATGGSGAAATFAGCLCLTMDGQGIVAYGDSEELGAGDRIDGLLRAVGDSKIGMPVISGGYASSARCLRKLARATELDESTGKLEILPIFFDVMASDVELRTELYAEELESTSGGTAVRFGKP